MPDDPIPEDVRRLLHRHFDSVSEVEVLVTLIRAPRAWTIPELADELVLNEEHAGFLLSTLARTPLVTATDDTYAFDPARAKDRAAAESLAQLYDRYRVRIMTLVFGKASEPLREFGEAFRLRSREEEE